MAVVSLLFAFSRLNISDYHMETLKICLQAIIA
jgi:hypothetical protein